MPTDPSRITLLLRRWVAGDSQALDQLIPLVYDRLREIAPARTSRAESLIEHDRPRPRSVLEAHRCAAVQDRGHFLALASRVMRHVLVDYARSRRAAKRGGGVASTPLDEHRLVSDENVDAIVEMNDALQRLESLDERRSRISSSATSAAFRWKKSRKRSASRPQP